MNEIKEFLQIAPYLSNPMVLIGFALLLFFGIHRALIKSGIIPPLQPQQGGKLIFHLLRYGFIVALIVIILGFILEFIKITISHKEVTAMKDETTAVRKKTEEIAGLIQKDVPLSCENNFFVINIKERFQGPFFNRHGYDLYFQLKNKLSQPIFITEIRALFANEEVINRVPAIRDLYEKGNSRDYIYYYSKYENPGVFAEKEMQEIYLRGPKFIPRTIEFNIFHSGAQYPSQCKINVSLENEVIYETPKKIDLGSYLQGIHGRDAISRAAPLLRRLPNDTKLISVISGSSKTKILPNGLYIVEVSEWILYYRNMDSDGLIIVDENGERAVPTERDDRSLSHLINPERILIGTKEAVEIATRRKLIVTNGEGGWALLRGFTPSEGEFPVWRLPYVGIDYLNIFVNAETGTIIPSRLLYKEYSRIETGSTSRLKRKAPAENDDSDFLKRNIRTPNKALKRDTEKSRRAP